MKYFLVVLLQFFAVIAFSATAEEVKIKTKSAASSAVDYTVEQKESFQKSMQENIDSLKSDLEVLKAKAISFQGEAKEKSNKKIKVLQKKQDELTAKMETLKNSSGRAWAKLKKGMNSTWDKAKQTVKEAKEEL